MLFTGPARSLTMLRLITLRVLPHTTTHSLPTLNVRLQDRLRYRQRLTLLGMREGIGHNAALAHPL